MGVSGEKDRRTGAPQQVLSALQRQPDRDLDIYLDEIRGGDLASLKQAVEAYRRHCQVAVRRKMPHGAARFLDKGRHAGAIRHGLFDHGHVGDPIEAQVRFQIMNVGRQWLESINLPARPDQGRRKERVETYVRSHVKDDAAFSYQSLEEQALIVFVTAQRSEE